MKKFGEKIRKQKIIVIILEVSRRLLLCDREA